MTFTLMTSIFELHLDDAIEQQRSHLKQDLDDSMVVGLQKLSIPPGGRSLDVDETIVVILLIPRMNSAEADEIQLQVTTIPRMNSTEDEHGRHIWGEVTSS